MATPYAGFGNQEVYPDLPSKAAILTYSLAKSQACLEGNKRVATILLYAFLDLNEARLRTTMDELADNILAAAESPARDRTAIVGNLTTWLSSVIVAEGEEGAS